MTLRELSTLVGTSVLLEAAPGLRFKARVLDVKIAYGKHKVKIEAVAGEGKSWVNVDRVAPCNEAQGGRNAAS